MDGYSIASLEHMLGRVSEARVQSLMQDFVCPKNKDVEYFLHRKAIAFCKQGIAKTFLVFASYRGELVIVGYFTLAIKILQISKRKISKSLAKRLRKFGRDIDETNSIQIPAVLIGQLSKNFANGYNKLIPGDVLLDMAVEKIYAAQQILGGKALYLECEDEPRLVEFYNRNNFYEFGRRDKDNDEKDGREAYLLQMLRYNK